MVSILPSHAPKESRKADLMLVKFSSFSAKKPVGLMRCQNQDRQPEIYPNQLGNRVIKAQMLAVAEEQPGAAQPGDTSSEQPRRNSCRERQAPLKLAAETTSEAAEAKAAKDRDKANALGRQRDAVHRSACEELQCNEHWLQVSAESQEGARRQADGFPDAAAD